MQSSTHSPGKSPVSKSAPPGTKMADASSLSGTTAWASTWSTQAGSSVSSSACTGQSSSKARVWALQTCTVSSPGTAAACGRRPSPTAARRFTFPSSRTSPLSSACICDCCRENSDVNAPAIGKAMERRIKVLHLEDDARDAQLIAYKLRAGELACDIVHVSNKAAFGRALDGGAFDLVLCDYNLGDYDGLSALKLARSKQPDTPVIMISGTLSDDEAVDCLKAGATDYVLKQRLQRLAPAASRAIREAKEKRGRRKTEADLRLKDLAIDAATNAIFIVDARAPGHPIVHVNRAFEKMTGYGAEESIGRNSRFLQGPDRDQPELEHLRLAIEKGTEASALLRNYRKDGTLFWNNVQISPVRDESGEITHYVGVQSDVTELKNYQIELEYRANYDSLTGLANKNLLDDRLSQAIAWSNRVDGRIAILYLDLDRFKIVNDSLGHAKGDALLKCVAERLGTCVRESDTVARLGGDEFAVVLHGIDASPAAA